MTGSKGNGKKNIKANNDNVKASNIGEPELIPGQELIKLFTALSPNTKAQIIANKLKNIMFINSGTDGDEHIYILQPNATWKKYEYKTENLYPIITKLVEDSYDNMDNDSRKLLEDRFEKKSDYQRFITRCFSNEEIKKYEPQLKSLLKRTDVELDNYTWQVHYNNGYIDLTTKTFKKRTDANSYVTYCINRDYKPSKPEEREQIMKHIKKIYPDSDLDCILTLLAKCLIGKPQNDQDTLFLMGSGSSAKSFIMSLTKEALGGDNGYVVQLQSSSFEQNNPKRDKILNTFANTRHVLICWVNEFSDKKIATDDFKNFCDGLVQTTRLFKDGTYQIKLKCKLIATTNAMPNFQIDTGSVRRFLAYTHQSKFVDDDSKVDEKNRIFKKDPELLMKIKQAGLLDAWIDILSEKCKEVYNGKKIELTENFKDTTSTVVSTNDFFQDFIDSVLEITNDKNDRIGKKIMKNKFDERYPEKRHITVQQIISSLKERGIIYECKLRCPIEHDQGCFIGVKFKSEDIAGTTNNTKYNELMDKYEKAEEENNALKDEIEKLRSENSKLKQRVQTLESDPYSVIHAKYNKVILDFEQELNNLKVLKETEKMFNPIEYYFNKPSKNYHKNKDYFKKEKVQKEIEEDLDFINNATITLTFD